MRKPTISQTKCSTKLCPRCQSDKPVGEFGRNRTRGDGLQGYCKVCTREYTREYRADDPERRKGYDRKHYQNNKEGEYLRLKQWRKENPDKHLEQNRKWNRENKEKKQERARERHQENPDVNRNKKSRRRAKQAGNEVGYKHGLVDVIISQNGICVGFGIYPNCEYGSDNIRWTEDHIIPIDLGGPDRADNIQAMCKRCNSSKSGRTMEEWVQANLDGRNKGA